MITMRVELLLGEDIATILQEARVSCCFDALQDTVHTSHEKETMFGSVSLSSEFELA